MYTTVRPRLLNKPAISVAGVGLERAVGEMIVIAPCIPSFLPEI